MRTLTNAEQKLKCNFQALRIHQRDRLIDVDEVVNEGEDRIYVAGYWKDNKEWMFERIEFFKPDNEVAR
jgi:hypothetical protein